MLKFVGYYQKVNKQKQSGQSCLPVYNQAKIYSNDSQFKEFIYDHTWHLFRVEPKQMRSNVKTSQSSGGSSKISKINEAIGYYLSNSNLTTAHSDGDVIS